MHVVKGQGYIVGSATNEFIFFRFTSIGHAIPAIQLFKNLIFKIQGQGHDEGQN